MTVDGDLGGEPGGYKSPSTVRFEGDFFFGGGLFQVFEEILGEFLDFQKSFRGFFFPGICLSGETEDFLL